MPTSRVLGLVYPVLFLLSFPPLCGGKLVAVLCGIVYGVWVGFAFTTVGTLLGEVGNFFVFRYFLPSTAGTFERKSLTCACLAHICRHGGFFIVLATRMSAIPRRLTTALFFYRRDGLSDISSCCRVFPSQVSERCFLGCSTEPHVQNGLGKPTVVKWAVVIGVVSITIVIAICLWHCMNLVRPQVQNCLRLERYGRLQLAKVLAHDIKQTLYELHDRRSL